MFDQDSQPIPHILHVSKHSEKSNNLLKIKQL